jgi:hypothetical protein
MKRKTSNESVRKQSMHHKCLIRDGINSIFFFTLYQVNMYVAGSSTCTTIMLKSTHNEAYVGITLKSGPPIALCTNSTRTYIYVSLPC